MMTDYKKKMLADIYELGRNEYIDRVTLYQQIEQILAAMPSAIEIAKGLHRKWHKECWLKDHPTKRFSMSFQDWLEGKAASDD